MKKIKQVRVFGKLLGHYTLELFKFQRALFPTNARILVYNKDHSTVDEFDMTPELHKGLFPNDELRVFRWCYLNKRGLLQVMHEESDPGW